MLNMRINSRKVWYAFYVDDEPVKDENGDLTGEYRSGYGKPKMTRANLSAARGTAENDIFGTNIRYSKTMSTSKMNLGIDEKTLIWDKPPVLNEDGTADPKSATYRVAAIAAGHYHVHYALRQLNVDEDDS